MFIYAPSITELNFVTHATIINYDGLFDGTLFPGSLTAES